jgi:NADH-quinone oxidoreductase subunit N
MSEWLKEFVLKTNKFCLFREFKSLYFLMNFSILKIIWMYTNFFKSTLVFLTFFKNINLENFFLHNFYAEIYFIEYNWYFEFLPEIFLIFFILYNLITIFNDVNKTFFQYYRWLFLYVLIFFIIFWKFFNFSGSQTEILLGFSWINCFYTIFSKLVIITLTILVFWISKNKLKNSLNLVCIVEFPLILSFSVLFMFLLSSSYDFFGIYLSIEGLSLTLYVLAGILYKNILSIESTIKYFSLGAISSGFLLLGISIIFGIIGSLDFLEIQIFLGSYQLISHFFEIKIGFLFILIGFLFKISAFPFHIWIVDVYEGIFSPITAFFAIVVKVCLILFFIRLTFNLMFNIIFFFQPLIIFSAIGSMLSGSIGALKQVRIKRFIAYTSINQVGFIMLGISSCNFLGLIASILYIILYSIMSIIFFTILLNTQHVLKKKSMVYLSDLYHFSLYNNENSKFLIITILSMGGIPPLAGFFGKLFLYFSIIESRLDILLFVTLIISIISSYYYLNFVRYILFEKYVNHKLFHFIQQGKFNSILKFFSAFLVLFGLILSNFFSILTSLSLSCAWPLIWY